MKEQLSQEIKEQYKVHYVWINSNNDVPEGCLCTVPLHYLDHVYKNAIKYPSALFTVWVDKSMIDLRSDFFVMSHGYLAAPNNVEFRNLRDIQAISDLAFFNEDCSDDIYQGRKLNIWGRVDLARLYVLEQALNDEPDFYHLYVDFDIIDINIYDPKMYRALATEGIFIGQDPNGRIENGYMCVGKGHGQTYLSTTLIPDTVVHVTEYECNGWVSLVNTFNEPWFDTESLSGQRQEASGYVLPVPDCYKNWGLN